MKSFLALERSATFTIRKDGIECKFISYIGDEFMEYDLIYEKPTEEVNGFTCELDIKGWYEYKEFCTKAKKRLAYYDTVLLYIENNLHNNTIIRNEDWQYSNNVNDVMHICLKDVYYEINWNQLGITQINLPIALRFNLDSGLTPTPSRESLIMNTLSKDIILEKIKKVANWFSEKYNSDWKEYETFLDAYPFIDDDTKKVTINNTHFIINDLIKHSEIGLKELRIKGVTLKSPSYYKSNRYEFFKEYVGVAKVDRGYWKVKHIKTECDIYKTTNNTPQIIVDECPSRNIRKFLLKKYSNRNLLFIKKSFNRELIDEVEDINENNYRYLLNLDILPREEWQGLIDEWDLIENQLKTTLIDETNVENSEEYITWLAKVKLNQKLDRRYSSKSNHKVLNKQVDEVTLSTGRLGINNVIFDKHTFKISELHQRPGLTIYFNSEDKLKAIQYYRLMSPRIRIVLVGKREELKIKNKHNFMSEQEFQKSKMFKKIVTSILFDTLIEKYNNILNTDSFEIINKLLEPLAEDIRILKTYTSNNGKNVRDNELLQSMIAIANEYNLFDYQYMDVYNRCNENLQKYTFLNYIKPPKSREEQDLKDVKSLINKFIYHQKVYHNQFDNLEITIKEEELELAE